MDGAATSEGAGTQETAPTPLLLGLAYLIAGWNLFEVARYAWAVFEALSAPGLSRFVLGVIVFFTGVPLFGVTLALAGAPIAVAQWGWLITIAVSFASYFLKSLPVFVWGITVGWLLTFFR